MRSLGIGSKRLAGSTLTISEPFALKMRSAGSGAQPARSLGAITGRMNCSEADPGSWPVTRARSSTPDSPIVHFTSYSRPSPPIGFRVLLIKRPWASNKIFSLERVADTEAL